MPSLPNQESGYGRYDVVLEPIGGGDAFILEFKVFDPGKEKSLEDAVQAALKQIEEKRYETKMLQKGISKNSIKKYGFAFGGKKVLIGRAQILDSGKSAKHQPGIEKSGYVSLS